MISRGFVSVALIIMLAACGGGGSSDAPLGTVKVSITDAPIDDAEAVWVQVSGVAFKPEGAAPEIVQNFTARPINLLQYQQGKVAVLLDQTPLPAGHYEWLRLIIDSQPNVRDSYVMVNGQECELSVPSGAETGLKMNRGFTIAADGSLALTIDFDLRKSLRAPPGQASGACASGYLLRPTLRLVDDANVGAVTGTVSFDSGAIPAGCIPKVYLYEGTVTPDDLEDVASANDVDPMNVINVEAEEGAASGTYKAAFIPAGTYTAAFTCDDDTDADESLIFSPSGGVPVTVQNNLISTVNFAIPAPP